MATAAAPSRPMCLEPRFGGLGGPRGPGLYLLLTVSQPLPLTPVGIQDGALRSPPQGPAQGRWQGRSRVGRASASFLESAYWSLPCAFNNTWFTERAKVCKAWTIRHTPGALFVALLWHCPRLTGVQHTDVGLRALSYLRDDA